jgi:hypothetical protein
MAITIESAARERAGRPAVWFTATGDSSEPRELDALIDAVEVELGRHGLRLADLVRTRILAASRPARDAASRTRATRLLAGPAASASSSYIEPRLFPGGDGVRFEGLVIRAAGDGKVVVRHDDGSGLCRYVATGDLVFLTGMTSTLPTFDAQLANLAQRVAATLDDASTNLGRPVRPTAVTTFVARIQEPGDAAELAERLGLPGVALEIERCDGFSSPGKLIEVEVDGGMD